MPPSPYRVVSIYISPKTAIVAPKYGSSALTWEQESPTVLPSGYDSLSLGSAVKKSLELFATRNPPNFRNHRIADWPAYRASNCRSGKAFQREFVHIQIRCEADMNTAGEAEVLKNEPTGIKTSVPIGPKDSDAELGEKLIELARLATEALHNS